MEIKFAYIPDMSCLEQCSVSSLCCGGEYYVSIWQTRGGDGTVKIRDKVRTEVRSGHNHHLITAIMGAKGTGPAVK